MKRSKKKDNQTLNNIFIFTTVIIILFMSIVCIELITIIFTEKINTDNLGKIKTPTNKQFSTYDTSNLDFINIAIKNDEYYIEDICKNGCNINATLYSVEYKYILEYKGGNYILDIVKDEKILLSDKNLGKSISNAYFKRYLNNVLFFNIIDDSFYNYDYVNIVNADNLIDEFTSLDSNELELTDDGIIYYYDFCGKNEENNKNAKKIKAIRVPFNVEPKVLSFEYTNYEWCNKAR